MLTVALSTFNRAKSLGRCLDALCQARPPDGGWKLLIADDGSTDETLSVLGGFARTLPVECRSSAQSGKSAALNSLIPELAGDLVVFCDDDILVSPDWLIEHRRLADSLPEYDVFGGCVLPEWELPPPAWILESVPLGAVYGITPDRYAEGPCSPRMVWGGNMSVRLRVFREGFRFDPRSGPNASDSGYRMGAEIQFVARLVAAGYRCRFSRKPVVRHIIRREQLDREWILGRAFRHGRQHGERHLGLSPARRLVARWRRAAKVQAWRCLKRLDNVVPLNEAIRFRADWHSSFHEGFLRELAPDGDARKGLWIAGPVAIGYTPDSPLSRPSANQPRFVGDRPRLATCSGVAWLDDSHLAAVNLARNSIHMYTFDRSDHALGHARTIVGLDDLARPENIAFSPDGGWLAITSSLGGVVNLYAVDRDACTIGLRRAAFAKSAGDVNSHGVCFSPCSRFLLYTTVDDPGFLRLCKIVRDARGGVEVIPVQGIRNTFVPYRPKGVAFSPDGRFVVLAYGFNAGRRTGRAKGFVCVHSFDPETGLGVKPLHSSGGGLGLRAPEDVNFLPDSSYVVVTDQGADRALFISFDKITGALGGRPVVLDGPRARLRFPHGNAVSNDGRYLAVANYGDDKVTIYTISSARGQEE